MSLQPGADNGNQAVLPSSEGRDVGRLDFNWKKKKKRKLMIIKCQLEIQHACGLDTT